MVVNRHTVLIVEDTRVVRRMANRILTEEGYRVLEAADAEEAIAVLEMPQAQVDLVLLDVVLPEKDGVALYADICARWPCTAVLFMSAYAAEILAARGQEDLTVPFLAKPFTPEELVTKVGATIERRRSPRSASRDPSSPP
jgi:two-component system cell cycle sensor histidine kinase/response regulator CckA